MTIFDCPMLELAVAAPLAGAVGVRYFRTTETAWKLAISVTILSLIGSVVAWVAMARHEEPPAYSFFNLLFGTELFELDRLSAPLVPLIAILHLLTLLMTPRVKMNRTSFSGHLLGESIRLATFACIKPWPLIILLALGVLPPLQELLRLGKPLRVFVFHMGAFVILLALGWLGHTFNIPGASAMVMLAVLIRSGTFPGHLWVRDLFHNATFGTALLFTTPIAGVYATLRLVLPVAPDWVLQGIGIASLATALYAGGLAIIQTEARRLFACLFISQSSLILIGLELHTAVSLAGALSDWLSATLSLTGLGLCLRALEGRHGRIQFAEYRGLGLHTPQLAIFFLIMGLACVGFPATLGFMSIEVLVDGVMEASLPTGIVSILTTTLCGIAILRSYFLIFTGTTPTSSVPLKETWRERVAVLSLTAVIFVLGIVPQLVLMDRTAAAHIVLSQSIP